MSAVSHDQLTFFSHRLLFEYLSIVDRALPGILCSLSHGQSWHDDIVGLYQRRATFSDLSKERPVDLAASTHSQFLSAPVFVHRGDHFHTGTYMLVRTVYSMLLDHDLLHDPVVSDEFLLSAISSAYFDDLSCVSSASTATVCQSNEALVSLEKDLHTDGNLCSMVVCLLLSRNVLQFEFAFPPIALFTLREINDEHYQYALRSILCDTDLRIDICNRPTQPKKTEEQKHRLETA